MKSTDFRDYKDGLIYIIGIGGCSTSGLAQILHNMGYRVTGSDMQDTHYTEPLKELGIPFFVGH
nr:hypothetical protein [Clostridia bacterium]